MYSLVKNLLSSAIVIIVYNIVSGNRNVVRFRTLEGFAQLSFNVTSLFKILNLSLLQGNCYGPCNKCIFGLKHLLKSRDGNRKEFNDSGSNSLLTIIVSCSMCT